MKKDNYFLVGGVYVNSIAKHESPIMKTVTQSSLMSLNCDPKEFYVQNTHTCVGRYDQ